MTRLQTELFVIEIPALFEKVLRVGALIRAERMDRSPKERSFAELNFYVGAVADEKLALPADASAEAIAQSAWLRHLARARQLESFGAPVIVSEERTKDGVKTGVLDLPDDGARPASRQVVEIRGFAASNPPCFSSFVLEYDVAFDELYRSIAASMRTSIEWRPEPFNAQQLARQGSTNWSIFDDMAPDRAAAIKRRYAEIVRPRLLPEAPAGSPKILDLTSLEDKGVTVVQVQAFLSEGSGALIVRAPAFEAPIEVDVDDERDGTFETIATMLAYLAGQTDADRAQAAHHAWAHCKLCFDVTDYGAPAGQSNEDYFGIRGPQDAASQLGRGCIFIGDDSDDASGSLFGIQFYPSWEQEHGCVLVVREGRFVGWTEGGGTLTPFYGGA